MKPLDEPFFRKSNKFTGTVSAALSWYRTNASAAQQKRWIIEWLENYNGLTRLPFTEEKPYPPDVVERVRTCNEKDCVPMGAVARLLHRGVELESKHVTKLHDLIKSLKPKPTPPPRPIPNEELNRIRQHIDLVVDDICRHKKPKLPPIEKEKWRESLSADQKKTLSGKYQRMYEEVMGAASEDDKTLTEAYGNLTAFQIDALLNYLRTIVVIPKPTKTRK